MTGWLERLSIPRQLILMIFGTTGLSLLLAFVFVMSYEYRESRATLINQSKLFARIAGDYSVGALAFVDRRAAAESLAKLEAVPEVDCAYLYDNAGQEMASFQRSGRDLQAPDLQPPAVELQASHVLVAHPIVHASKAYGSISLCVSTAPLRQRVLRYLKFMIPLLALMIVLSALAAFRLQGVVSKPVLDLAKFAQQVSRDDDYSIRADVPTGRNEVTALFREWNEMLRQIELRSQERASYEAALQRNEHRFRTIIESSPSSMFVALAGRPVFINPHFEQVFGYGLEEIAAPGFDLRLLVTADSWGLLPGARDTAMLVNGASPASGQPSGQDPGPMSYDIRGVSKSGRILDFELTLTPISWDQSTATLGILRNITERKLAQVEREQELLRETNQHLERYARALESSNENLQQFAYVASHDLQEPLRTVSSFVQLLSRRYKGQLDADADEFIGFVVDGVVRMKSLIEDLLAYSRINNQRPLEPTDCQAVVKKVVQSLHSTITEHQTELSIGPLPTVHGDASQLSQLFQNLIGNAIKFRGAEPPLIEVSAERVEDHWLFTVEDNGIGIEEQYQERIFVIFQRLHGQDQYPGTGIGLAICKRIVERHHGRIWLRSTPGEGTAFSFELPALETGLPEPLAQPNRTLEEVANESNPE